MGAGGRARAGGHAKLKLRFSVASSCGGARGRRAPPGAFYPALLHLLPSCPGRLPARPLARILTPPRTPTLQAEAGCRQYDVAAASSPSHMPRGSKLLTRRVHPPAPHSPVSVSTCTVRRCLQPPRSRAVLARPANRCCPLLLQPGVSPLLFLSSPASSFASRPGPQRRAPLPGTHRRRSFSSASWLRAAAHRARGSAAQPRSPAPPASPPGPAGGAAGPRPPQSPPCLRPGGFPGLPAPGGRAGMPVSGGRMGMPGPFGAGSVPSRLGLRWSSPKRPPPPCRYGPQTSSSAQFAPWAVAAVLGWGMLRELCLP